MMRVFLCGFDEIYYLLLNFFFFLKEINMLINILTLIGIGTVAWSVAKLIKKILEWINIRQTGLRK